MLLEARINQGGFLRLIGGLKRQATNTGPLMKAIARDMEVSTEDKFEREEGVPKAFHNRPSGGPIRPWKRLKDSTRRARARKGHWPGLILQAEGKLASSVSTSFSRNTARVGSNSVYATTHEFGDRGRNIPDRSFLALSTVDIDRINKRIGEFLIK